MENGDKQKLNNLTSEMDKVQNKLDTIMCNHLPHIQAELEAMKVKFWILFAGAGFLIGLLVAHIMEKV